MMDDLISRQAAIDASKNKNEHLKTDQNALNEDLISRKTAIDAIEKIFPVNPMRNDYTQGITCGAALATEYIKQLPSAQPERKKGQWIRHDEVKNVYGGICIECPECGEKYVVQYIEDEKYCRNCGADMRGEQND